MRSQHRPGNHSRQTPVVTTELLKLLNPSKAPNVPRQTGRQAAQTMTWGGWAGATHLTGTRAVLRGAALRSKHRRF